MNGTPVVPVLVFGGTGHLGRHIVRSLLRRGAAVRVLSRDAANARQVLGDAPEIIQGDITSVDSVAAALNGAAAAVISVSAMTPQLIRRVTQIERDAVLAVLVEAERAGVPRVIFISVYDIQEGLTERLDLASGKAKAEVETALRRSSLNWTVLGAAPSMQLFFAMIRGETMLVPGGGPPALPTIAPTDVGEIAAEAVRRDDLGGKRFRMVGPEALSFPEAARRISAVIGRPIRFRAIPLALPKLAWAVTRPLARFSDRALYVHQMLGFVRLLNRFPPEIAAEAPVVHRLLRETFHYTPTTLEMEAQRWQDGRA